MSTSRGENPPIRIVTRLLAEMQTTIVGSGVRALGGELVRSVIFTLVVRQSLSDGAAISTYSLANSLSRPYETVRRHIGALIALGMCERTAAGVVARPAVLTRPPFSAAMTVAHDSFVRFVDDLKTLGVPMPQQRDTQRYIPPLGVQAAVDIMLAVTDTNRDTHRDWAELVIFSTVLCGNVRDFARDPVLARQYADQTTPSPEALRKPVRPSSVARAIGISESTVRRRCEAMLADGRLERVRGGLRVHENWLNRPESIATSLDSYQNIKRILERIAAAGFPFDDPASAYLDGRPADARFD